MKYKHLLSSEEKLKHWGYGEWVEEPELAEFTHLGLKCRVKRCFLPESDGSLFGGYLVGYVRIPVEIPLSHIKIAELYNIPLDIHGGVTYFMQEQDGHWIGFDCAHFNDLVPSIAKFKNKLLETNAKFKALAEKVDPLNCLLSSSPFLCRTYRNLNYAIQQCKSLAKQVRKEIHCNLNKNNS